MAALITDPMLQEELIEKRRAAGIDKFDEVWDGVYVMSPIADNEHQGWVKELTTILTIAVDWPGHGTVYPGVNVTDQQQDWKYNFRVPDVAVFLNDTQAEDRGSHWYGGPDLAIEVVSPHDRSTEKLPFYAKVGARELMLIGRNPLSITLYRLQGDKLMKVGVSSIDDPAVLASEVVPVNWRIRSVDGRTSLELLHHDGQQRWVINLAHDK